MIEKLSFQEVASLMNAQNQRRLEQLEKDIRAATIPFSDDLLGRIVWNAVGQSHKFLRLHPGFRMAKKFEAYVQCRDMFYASKTDLDNAIDCYKEFLERPDADFRNNDPEKSRLEMQVLKRIFTFSNAAHALQEHSTRGMKSIVNIDETQNKLNEYFGNDNLHDFIIGTRNIIHHIHLHRPEVQTKIVFDPRTVTAKLYLQKYNFDWLVEEYRAKISSGARAYILNMPEKVFVDDLYNEYFCRAKSFHHWFSEYIETKKPSDAADYQRCALGVKKISTRVHWRAFIGIWLQWEHPPNPYDYLERYLTQDQMNEVKSFEHRSRSQIDRIIDIVDVNEACNPELRDMIYRWFEKSKPAS